MSDSDRRAFSYFAQNKRTSEEVDYLAYASYASAKFDWIDRYIEQNKRSPTQAEIDKWVDELPDSRLNEIHTNASRVFRQASRDYVSAQIRKDLERKIFKSIEENLKSITSFSLKNIAINCLISSISVFIIAAIIMFCSYIFAKDPSPIAFYKTFLSFSDPYP